MLLWHLKRKRGRRAALAPLGGRAGAVHQRSKLPRAWDYMCCMCVHASFCRRRREEAEEEERRKAAAAAARYRGADDDDDDDEEEYADDFGSPESVASGERESQWESQGLLLCISLVRTGSELVWYW